MYANELYTVFFACTGWLARLVLHCMEEEMA